MIVEKIDNWLTKNTLVLNKEFEFLAEYAKQFIDSYDRHLVQWNLLDQV